MSDVPFTREQFLEALNGIAGGRTTAQQLTRNLRRALLDFGSEAPDNLNCAGQVEVGPVGSEIGPKITGRDVLFRALSRLLVCCAKMHGVAMFHAAAVVAAHLSIAAARDCRIVLREIRWR